MRGRKEGEKHDKVGRRRKAMGIIMMGREGKGRGEEGKGREKRLRGRKG